MICLIISSMEVMIMVELPIENIFLLLSLEPLFDLSAKIMMKGIMGIHTR